MDVFATARDETTPEKLARRLFDVSDPDTVTKVTAALVDRNPALAEGIAPGLMVELPQVEGVGLRGGAQPLPDASATAALHVTRESLPDVADRLHERAAAQVADATERVRG